MPPNSEIQQKSIYGAKTVGTGVEMCIAGAGIKMHYEDAFNLAMFLRSAAKEAKYNAGDFSKRYRIHGLLTDTDPSNRLPSEI